jgi:hypothetical protein
MNKWIFFTARTRLRRLPASTRNHSDTQAGKPRHHLVDHEREVRDQMFLTMIALILKAE